MAKRKVINANIILYGPPRAGKTSNIQFIHRKLKPSQRGQIVPLSQDGYPQVSYEFLPIELGELKGYDTNLYIYTSPDHDDGLETRLNLLNEAAGVVFIADSDPDRMDDNIESLTDLKEELRYWNMDYDTFPLVFQYNKRDLPNALSREEMEAQLNPEGKESFDAVASAGQGVRDTFALISKMAVRKVRLKLVRDEADDSGGDEERRPAHEAPRAAEVKARIAIAREKGSPIPPSDVTLDVAPPPRYDEDDEPEEGAGAEAEELEAHARVKHGDARREGARTDGIAEPLHLEVVRDDQPTDHGMRDGVEPEISNEAVAAEPVGTTSGSAGMVGPTSDETQMEEEAPTVPTDKGRRKDKRGGRKKEQGVASSGPTDAEVESAGSGEVAESAAIGEAVQKDAGLRDDFLKTTFSFEDEPLLIATLEAGEADEADAADDEDDDQEPYSSYKESPTDGLGMVSLPENASLAGISFAEIADQEVNIQTYADEEEEDEDEPMIRLGARALEGEELQLEEEMLLDDEESPEEDEDLPPEDRGDPTVEVPFVPLSSGSGITAEPTTATASLTELPPLTPYGQDEEEDDRSIIATRQELDEAGVNDWAQPSGPPMVSLDRFTELDREAAAEAAAQRAVVDEDEEGDDEEISSGRFDTAEVLEGAAAGPSAGSDVPAQAATGTSTEEFVSPEVPVDVASSQEEPQMGYHDEDPFGDHVVVIGDAITSADAGEAAPVAGPHESDEDQLPDMAISPLEDEAESRPADFEMSSQDPVFETQGEGQGDVAEMRAESPVAGDGAAVAALEGIAPSGVAEDEDEQIFDEGREADDDHEPRLPTVTGWGAVTRIDPRTLIMPVSVRLPGVTQEVQLSIRLQVDLMLEELLAVNSGAGNA